MIRPEPDTFDDLLRELTAERFGTTNRDRPGVWSGVDTAPAFAHRRKVLDEALDDEPASASDGTVIQLRRGRAA